MTITLSGAQAPAVQLVSAKGDWQPYRTVTAADPDSVSNLSTPQAILPGVEPVNASSGVQLFLRLRAVTSGATLNYKVVGWGRNDAQGRPGQVLATGVLTTRAEMAGGRYLSDLAVTDTRWCRFIQVFVTAVTGIDAAHVGTLDVVGV